MTHLANEDLTPDTVVDQHNAVLAALRRAGQSMGDGQVTDDYKASEPHSNIRLLPTEQRSIPRQEIPTMKIALQHRDFTMHLQVIDVCVGEDQIGVIMPASLHVETIRNKAKFDLVFEEQRYPIAYFGGNFTFTAADPELRMLTFMRLPTPATSS